MSGIGSSEFILLLVIGLIVLGPKRLPEIASKIGGWIGQARRMTRVMKRQLEDELNLDEHKSILPTTSPFATAPAETDTPSPAASEPEEDPALSDPELAAHIPNDDDTFSPIHSEEDDAESSADADTAKEPRT
jgi:sec-independent protein translocase protein TatB